MGGDAELLHQAQWANLGPLFRYLAASHAVKSHSGDMIDFPVGCWPWKPPLECSAGGSPKRHLVAVGYHGVQRVLWVGKSRIEYVRCCLRASRLVQDVLGVGKGGFRFPYIGNCAATFGESTLVAPGISESKYTSTR